MANPTNRGMPTPFQKAQEVEKLPEVTEEKEAVKEEAEPVISSQAEKFEKLKASLPKNKPVNVIALRAGYYRKERKNVGDKFTIQDPSQLGTWMKPY